MERQLPAYRPSLSEAESLYKTVSVLIRCAAGCDPTPAETDVLNETKLFWERICDDCGHPLRNLLRRKVLPNLPWEMTIEQALARVTIAMEAPGKLSESAEFAALALYLLQSEMIEWNFLGFEKVDKAWSDWFYTDESRPEAVSRAE